MISLQVDYKNPYEEITRINSMETFINELLESTPSAQLFIAKKRIQIRKTCLEAALKKEVSH